MNNEEKKLIKEKLKAKKVKILSDSKKIEIGLSLKEDKPSSVKQDK